MSSKIKTIHGVAILGTCFLVAISLINYTSKNFSSLILISNNINPHTQLAQVADVTSGLVGHWTFDEGSGTTANDTSGNGNTGTLVGGPSWSINSKIGSGSLSFSGNSQYVNVASSDSLKPQTAITISFWMNASVYPSNNNYNWISKGSTSGYRVRPTSTAGIGFQLIFNNHLVTACGILNDISFEPNIWKLLTITSDNSGTKCYMNDSLSSGGDSTPWVETSGVNALQIGNLSNSGANIDDVRIYNRALPISEIKQLYSEGSNYSSSDTTSPSIPANLSAIPVSSTRINLSWTASTDNTAVSGYKIFRNGTQITTSVSNSFSDTNLIANTTYQYTVSAYDAANNESAQSTQVSATTDAQQTQAFTLTIQKSGTGQGTVTATGIDCGSDCSETIKQGTSVRLTAIPQSDSAFAGWSGGGCSGVGDCVFILKSDTTISASFNNITNSQAPVARITVLPNVNVEVGEEVYFDALQTTDDKPLMRNIPEYTNSDEALPKGHFEWDFGDGYAVKYGWKGNSPWSSGLDSGISVTHFFMSPGTYPVTLYVTDIDGNKDSATLNITVSGETPIQGFELWHASFNARIAQYIYAQIPSAYRNNSTRLRITLEGNNGYFQILLDKNNLQAEEQFILNNANLSSGNYILQAELLDRIGSHISSIKEKYNKSYNGSPKVGINENNSLVVGGKLFFPVTPWILDPSKVTQWSNEKYINTLYGIGYYNNSMTYPQQWQDYLNLGKNNNLMVIGPVNGKWEGNGILHHERNSDVSKLVSLVNLTKNYPALLGWMWKDEPGLGGRGNNLPGTVIRSWTYLTHLNDDQHPVVINHYGFDYLPYVFSGGSSAYTPDYNFMSNAKYFGKKTSVFDIVGLDNYPYEYRGSVGYTNSSRGVIDQHIDSIENLKSVEYNLVPVWDFIETQDIRSGAGTGITANQITMLAWLDIVHGVKGINWFQYFMTTPNDNYLAMKKFVDQITRLSDVVLGPPSSRTISDNSNVRANRVDTMLRETATDIWVFTVRVTEPDTEWSELNGAAFEPTSINTTCNIGGLPGSATAEVLDEGRSISLVDGIFADSFAREAVHIYKIPKNSSTQISPSPCTSFTYSPWSLCSNSVQTRTVVSSSPTSCTGGTPILTQSCTNTTSPDFNSDGLVNTIDLSLLLSYWNQANSAYDLNNDGVVNSLDYATLVGSWSE